jgi:hypothetical protein
MTQCSKAGNRNRNLATGTLRARVAKPLTARPEIESSLLDGETGWRSPGGHGNGCAAGVFVTATSIWKIHRIATMEIIFMGEKVASFQKGKCRSAT